MGPKKNLFWIVYVIFALYLLNKAFSLIALPAFFLPYEKWVLVISAVLLVLGAYNSYKRGLTSF